MLDGWRRRWFPPERNQLAAHLTLFHALPPDVLGTLPEDLREVLPPEAPVGTLSGVRSLGRGVAVVVDVPGLDGLRSAVAHRYRDRLTRQDAHGFRAHVTVANFLPPARARALLEDLAAGFEPRPVRVPGVAVHRYRGGPWELVTEVRIGERPAGERAVSG
ncbi:2'-5' RNA ligase family protein [Kineococcus gynurae]|uniref:2'-5' RNA ligase family protein n=1 Tax=Kineococcus gynurae TaxID=452979 RepID=UPI0035E971E0